MSFLRHLQYILAIDSAFDGHTGLDLESLIQLGLLFRPGSSGLDQCSDIQMIETDNVSYPQMDNTISAGAVGA